MVCRAIETALGSGVFDKVFVSTDTDNVKRYALTYDGVVVLERLNDVQGNTFTVDDVLESHMLEWEWEKPVYICVLYPCTPLLEPNDLAESFSMMKAANASRCVAMKEYEDSPAFMAAQLEDSEFFLRRNPLGTIKKQLETTWYTDAGQFYWITHQAFMRQRLLMSDLSVLGYKLPRWRAVDINTEEDLNRAKYYYKTYISNEKQ